MEAKSGHNQSSLTATLNYKSVAKVNNKIKRSISQYETDYYEEKRIDEIKKDIQEDYKKTLVKRKIVVAKTSDSDLKLISDFFSKKIIEKKNTIGKTETIFKEKFQDLVIENCPKNLALQGRYGAQYILQTILAELKNEIEEIKSKRLFAQKYCRALTNKRSIIKNDILILKDRIREKSESEKIIDSQQFRLKEEYFKTASLKQNILGILSATKTDQNVIVTQNIEVLGLREETLEKVYEDNEKAMTSLAYKRLRIEDYEKANDKLIKIKKELEDKYQEIFDKISELGGIVEIGDSLSYIYNRFIKRRNSVLSKESLVPHFTFNNLNLPSKNTDSQNFEESSNKGLEKEIGDNNGAVSSEATEEEASLSIMDDEVPHEKLKRRSSRKLSLGDKSSGRNSGSISVTVIQKMKEDQEGMHSQENMEKVHSFTRRNIRRLGTQMELLDKQDSDVVQEMIDHYRNIKFEEQHLCLRSGEMLERLKDKTMILMNLRKELTNLKSYDKVLQKPVRLDQDYFDPTLSAKSSGLLITKKATLDSQEMRKGIPETNFEEYCINTINVIRNKRIIKQKNNQEILKQDYLFLQYYLKLEAFNARIYKIVESVRNIIDKKRKRLTTSVMLPCDLAFNIRFYGAEKVLKIQPGGDEFVPSVDLHLNKKGYHVLPPTKRKESILFKQLLLKKIPKKNSRIQSPNPNGFVQKGRSLLKDHLMGLVSGGKKGSEAKGGKQRSKSVFKSLEGGTLSQKEIRRRKLLEVITKIDFLSNCFIDQKARLNLIKYGTFGKPIRIFNFGEKNETDLEFVAKVFKHAKNSFRKKFLHESHKFIGMFITLKNSLLTSSLETKKVSIEDLVYRKFTKNFRKKMKEKAAALSYSRESFINSNSGAELTYKARLNETKMRSIREKEAELLNKKMLNKLGLADVDTFLDGCLRDMQKSKKIKKISNSKDSSIKLDEDGDEISEINAKMLTGEEFFEYKRAKILKQILKQRQYQRDSEEQSYNNKPSERSRTKGKLRKANIGKRGVRIFGGNPSGFGMFSSSVSLNNANESFMSYNQNMSSTRMSFSSKNNPEIRQQNYRRKVISKLQSLNYHEWKKEAKHIQDLKFRLNQKKMKVLKLSKNHLKPLKQERNQKRAMSTQRIQRKISNRLQNEAPRNSMTSRKIRNQSKFANTDRGYSIKSISGFKKKRGRAFLTRDSDNNRYSDSKKTTLNSVIN